MDYNERENERAREARTPSGKTCACGAKLMLSDKGDKCPMCKFDE